MTRVALIALTLITLVACKRDDPAGEPELDEGSVAAEEAADEAEPEEEAPAEAEAEEVAEAAEVAEEPRRPAREAVRPRIEVRRPEVEANRQLAEQLGLAPPPPLIVSDLLTRSDIREVTQYAGELQETTLDGIEPSPQYNAIRLSAGEAGYGAALQVWQFDEMRQATNHFRRLRETYFDQNVDGTPVANEACQASFFGLEHYAFLHRASKSVAVVSCDAEVCTGRQTRTLASRASTRL